MQERREGETGKRRKKRDHNEGMRVCRAVRRCLLDRWRHARCGARCVNGKRGTEMDGQPEGEYSYVCTCEVLWSCARLCVHCVHGVSMEVLAENKQRVGEGEAMLLWQPATAATIDSTYMLCLPSADNLHACMS